jgi:hypothetical protein
MRAVLGEVAGQMREDLRKQLTADSTDNPIVQIQKATLSAMKHSADQQGEHLRTMNERLEAMRLEVQSLKAEKEKLVEVAAEAERGTAKGRTYEESVFEALDAISVGQGDDCDAVGDVPGVGGKKGDVVVALDACAGPARGRIVFEAKNARLSKKQALAELDEAMRARDADYGIFVVPCADKLPAKTSDLREFGGDKLFVVFDPDEGGRISLEVAYKLARRRVLMARGDAGGDRPGRRAQRGRARARRDGGRAARQVPAHPGDQRDRAGHHDRRRPRRQRPRPPHPDRRAAAPAGGRGRPVGRSVGSGFDLSGEAPSDLHLTQREVLASPSWRPTRSSVGPSGRSPRRAG